MAEKSYVVTAACAMVKVGDRFRTVQQGGPVPPGADPDHVKLLLARKIIEVAEAAGGVYVDPNAKPPFVAPKEKAKPEGTIVDPYDGKTNQDLEVDIKQRNEGRPDDKQIKPASEKKDDLLAALKADDEAQVNA